MLTAAHLIEAATKLWGAVTSKPHPHEWRFRAKGSKSINLKDLTWYDHEAQEGGGVVELCARAGVGAQDKGGEKRDNSSNEIVYRYLDEKGICLFEVVKFPNKPKAERFRQRRPNGQWGIKGVRRILYRLPHLMNISTQDQIVFVCEGEKDADALAALDVVTTTNPGGASKNGNKWLAAYSEFLRGRDCIILPDNDEPGIGHAHAVQRALAGIAKSARVLKLPGLDHEGDDVSDWLNRGGTRDQLDALVAALGEEEPPPPPPPPQGWIDLCTTTESGAPISNFANAMIAMENDATLKDAYVYDDMQSHPMIVRSTPMKVSDDHINAVHRYLQQNGLTRLSRENAKHAIFLHASARHINPFKDFLDGLEWDGQPRIGTWLTDYLGAERNPYHDAIGAMFIRSMIARAFRPGCKVDYMMVLEGPQGILKSMACRVLAGDDYFTDSLPDIGSGKDVYLALRGIWIAEVSEMHAFNKADSTELKRFLSQQTNRYRPPYGMMEVEEPRRCVFIGTSNKDAYLRDETGGRRFWPVKCGTIKIDELRRDRDQLLAEAIVEFQAGVEWWPEREFEIEVIAPEQEKRFEVDIWQDKVDEALNGVFSDTTTISKIATIIGLNVERMGPREQHRIAACLRQAGWIEKRKTKQRWWQKA